MNKNLFNSTTHSSNAHLLQSGASKDLDDDETNLQIFKANRDTNDLAQVPDSVRDTLSCDARKGWAIIPLEQQAAILQGKPVSTRKINQ